MKFAEGELSIFLFNTMIVNIFCLAICFSVKLFVILGSDKRITLFAFDETSEIKFVLLWFFVVFLFQNFLYLVKLFFGDKRLVFPLVSFTIIPHQAIVKSPGKNSTNLIEM